MSPEASARDELQLRGGWGSVERGDIGTDQLCGLLVDAALAAVGMVLLKMRKRGSGRDWVHLVIAVVVERHVHKGIIREPEDHVAHAVRLGGGQFIKDPFDSSLVLIRCLSRAHRVARHKSLLHVAPFTDAVLLRHGRGDKLARRTGSSDKVKLRALARRAFAGGVFVYVGHSRISFVIAVCTSGVLGRRAPVAPLPERG
jgi:hypothetical protein